MSEQEEYTQERASYEAEIDNLRTALITALAYVDNAQAVLKQALEDNNERT